MIDLWLVVVLAAVGFVAVAGVAAMAIRAMGRAMVDQNALVDRLAVHLKSRDVFETKEAFAPEKEPLPPEPPRPFDTEERGFQDMRAAGLDPEDPDHLAIWNGMRRSGGVLSAGGVTQ